ncbi:MAG: hypothetical protein QW400_04025 [Candidatus Diapherotrites archaeon]
MPVIRPSTAYLARRMEQLFGKRRQPKKEKPKRNTSKIGPRLKKIAATAKRH